MVSILASGSAAPGSIVRLSVNFSVEKLSMLMRLINSTVVLLRGKWPVAWKCSWSPSSIGQWQAITTKRQYYRMAISDTGSHEFLSSTKFLPSLLGPSRKSWCVTFRCDIKAVNFFFNRLTFWPSLLTFLFQKRRATKSSSRDLCSKFYDSWFFWTPCFLKRFNFCHFWVDRVSAALSWLSILVPRVLFEWGKSYLTDPTESGKVLA